jgi:hypothetical protein
VADLNDINLMTCDALSSIGELEALALQRGGLLANKAIPVAWDLQPNCTLTVSSRGLPLCVLQHNPLCMEKACVALMLCVSRGVVKHV